MQYELAISYSYLYFLCYEIVSLGSVEAEFALCCSIIFLSLNASVILFLV